MTPVVEALRRAAEHGVTFLLKADRVRCRNAAALPVELFSLLHEALDELREILAGQRCRHCGSPLDWRSAGPVAFADGTATHVACYERAEVERLRAAAKRALDGVAAVSEHGDLLPEKPHR